MADRAGIGYSPIDAYVAISKGADTQAATGGTATYESFLEWVRKGITEEHAEELARAISDVGAATTVKTLIARYVSSAERDKTPAEIPTDKLIELIYQDMAGLGILTDLLQAPDVEEININGFRRGSIEIHRASGLEFLEDGFPSADAALNTVKKMVRMGGSTLDASRPVIDSYLGGGARISAMIPPIVREEDGVVASIRKQRKSRITREELIASQTATPDILDFLTCCVTNKCSVAFAGGMSSGKTTDMTYLLNEYITKNTDPNDRIMLIEDSREIETLLWDVTHNRPARVLYTATKPEPNPVTMRELVKEALRQDVQVIVPAECRDGAAYDVVDAGQTGQTIITSFHGKSAVEAYMRMLSLCQMAQTGMSEDMLLNYMISALPIMVFKERQKDRSRKYAEVFEATGHVGGKVIGQPLFRYKKDNIIYDERGGVAEIQGHFEKVNNISDALRARLEENGGQEVQNLLNRIFPV